MLPHWNRPPASAAHRSWGWLSYTFVILKLVIKPGSEVSSMTSNQSNFRLEVHEMYIRQVASSKQGSSHPFFSAVVIRISVVVIGNTAS